MNLSRSFRLLLDPQGGEGNGSSDAADGSKGADATPPSPSQGSQSQGDKAAETFKSLMDKHGDANTVAMQLAIKNAELIADNAGLREKNRDLKGRIPSEDKVKLWSALEAIGLDPEALKTAVAERDEYKPKALGYERREAVREIAGLYGFNPKVLLDRLGDGELPEIKEVTEGGKTVKRAFVKGSDGKPIDLAKHAEAQWSEYLPSLKPNGQRSPGTPVRRATTPAPPPDSAAANQRPRASLVR
jgi:hypothetical protein